MSNSRKEQLVSRRELEKIIDAVEGLEPYRDFLKARWVGMVMWWHDRSTAARRKYFLVRGIIIVGGVSIPVLSAFNLSAAFMPVTISVVGAVVAACAAWEGVTNYGEIWREKRRAAELLKVEGWQFIQLSGKYYDDSDLSDNRKYKNMFPRFAAEVENNIAKEIGEYLTVFDPSRDRPVNSETTLNDGRYKRSFKDESAAN
jgi:Protein of unknown function (DUF4231)